MVLLFCTGVTHLDCVENGSCETPGWEGKAGLTPPSCLALPFMTCSVRSDKPWAFARTVSLAVLQGCVATHPPLHYPPPPATRGVSMGSVKLPDIRVRHCNACCLHCCGHRGVAAYHVMTGVVIVVLRRAIGRSMFAWDPHLHNSQSLRHVRSYCMGKHASFTRQS